MDDMANQRRRQGAEDEIDEALDRGDERAEPEDAKEQDLALRGTMMSNAIPGGSAPAAGAVIGSGGELGMDPTIDEAELEERERRAEEQHGRG
jgi:hypothetical protein